MSKFINKIFRDKNDNIVLAQKINLPLFMWLVSTILKYFYKTGHFSSILGFTAFVSIIVWSTLELTTGVNYFRRFLGLVVFIVAVSSRF